MTRVTYTIIAIVVLSLVMMPQAAAAVPGGLSAVRDISEQTVVPGSTFTVTVTVTANEDIVASALDEDLPDGWTVAESDSAGAYYKESTIEWVWLTNMSSGDQKTVVYDVAVPGDAEPQEYEIAGTVSAHLVGLINVSGESTVTVAALPAMSATRDISEETVVPGSTFTVTVTLTATGDAIAPALDENLPDDWTVAENNSGGAHYKASTNEWIWPTAMSSGGSKTVVYDVTVPGDAEPQEYEIAGTVSAHLVGPIDVGGEETVAVEAAAGGYGGSVTSALDGGDVPPGSELSVARNISSQLVEPGSTFTVTLVITANEGVNVTAPTLTEDVPLGEITKVDWNGTQYKANTTEWVLLDGLSAGESLTVVYAVTVPGDALPQECNITGSASAYDVAAVEIGGDSGVTVESEFEYDSADTNQDCVVDMVELITQAGKWKRGEVGMVELMTSTAKWKLGSGGYC